MHGKGDRTVTQDRVAGGEVSGHGSADSIAVLMPRVRALEERLCTIVRGKQRAVRWTLTTLLAQGHLLIEDVPGVGKTTLALALASSLGCSFSRIQFTSDLLPSDILGVSIFNQESAAFEFRAGPIFHHIVLADELNRTTPKTQSCLLEAMSEGRVSVDGKAHLLPEPFMVIATQNPIEHHGTFPLPESQLDRFLMRLKLGYPDREAERLVLRGVRRPIPSEWAAQLSPADVVLLQAAVPSIRVDSVLEDYILSIVAETRQNRRIALGVSPRGAQALYRSAQATALLAGRSYVIPDDIKQLVVPVLSHRIIPSGMVGLVVPAEEAAALMQELILQIPVPG